MIVEYHRPDTVEQALELLARKEPLTLPFGGGTVLTRQANQSHQPVAIVDLQRLPVRDIRREGQLLEIGAGVTLQQLQDCQDIPEALRASLTLEAGRNVRCMATVAGTIVESTGRSPFVTALLALDPRLVWAEAGQIEKRVEFLGNFLALRTQPDTWGQPGGRMITAIQISLNAELKFESVARTPFDLPVVCAAAAAWPSGRTRLVLGGCGRSPVVAMDGPEANGIGMAARSAYQGAGDSWATAEYRASVAAVLAERLAELLRKGDA